MGIVAEDSSSSVGLSVVIITPDGSTVLYAEMYSFLWAIALDESLVVFFRAVRETSGLDISRSNRRSAELQGVGERTCNEHARSS